MAFDSIEEALKWFIDRPKPDKPPVYDFCRPLPATCQNCGYPFGNPPGMKFYPLKEIDCPEHMPAHWHYHEREALKVAKAVDRAETLIKEITR